jgi:uncharacterized protein (TIGR02001 family)
MGEETKPWAAVVTVTSDYDYRGLSQTAESAAVQMDPSYTFRHMRADIFLSNVNFGEGSGSAFFGKRHTEIAYTLDFYGGTNDSLLYDIGISYFTYPGWNPNVSYPEAYITLSRKWLSTSIHCTWAYDNPSAPTARILCGAKCHIPDRDLGNEPHSSRGWELGGLLDSGISGRLRGLRSRFG